MKIYLVAILLIISKLSFGQSNDYDPDLAADFAINQGKIAPNFVLEDNTGKKVALSEFKGKTVYLHFWADWCGVCIGELPALKELYERQKNDDLVFINIVIDSEKENWKKLINQYQIPGINLFDNKKSNDKTRSDAVYGYSVAPAYVLIDKTGKILGHDVPAPDEDIFADWVIAQAQKGIPTRKAYELYAKNNSEYTKWLKGYMSKL